MREHVHEILQAPGPGDWRWALRRQAAPPSVAFARVQVLKRRAARDEGMREPVRTCAALEARARKTLAVPSVQRIISGRGSGVLLKQKLT